MGQGRIDFSGFSDRARDPVQRAETADARYRGSNANVAATGSLRDVLDRTIGAPDLAAAGPASSGDGKPAARDKVSRRRRARTKTARGFPVRRIEGFVVALLDDGEEASRSLAATAFAECKNPQTLVEMLFKPAADIIGKGWQNDEIDFVKVTIATARMQRMFRRMAYENPPLVVPDVTRRALLAPAPGEQHAFGLLVVEDAFQRAGWDVDCCGCNEVDEMFCLAAANEYRIIGISISAERQLLELTALVRALREKSRNNAVVLIAGGGLIAENPQVAIGAGFDLTATDAASAVTLAGTDAGMGSSDSYASMAAE